MSKIDLHIHTKYSDGEYDENEIIEKVINAKVKEFAICDHDTIVGSKKVNEKLQEKNYDLIYHSGIELSCRIFDIFNGINVHLLVRDFDYNNKELLKIIDEVSNFRKIKKDRMVEYVEKIYNLKLDKKLIDKKFNETKSFGKPHIYELLYNYGNFDRIEFYKYMDKLNTDDLKIDVKNVFKALKNTKGNISLAHPVEIMKEYNLKLENIEKIIEYLTNLGLYGLEVYHSKQDKDLQLKLEKICDKYNLEKTYGSDYHGEKVKPDVEIGKCILQ